MSEVLLRGMGLTRRWGGLVAVDAVSLDLVRGAVHAVIGTNGAGKSTLINLLSGEIAPSAGRVELLGQDVTDWTQPRRARAGLGRSYQRNTIYPGFTVAENCRLAAQARHQRAWRFWQDAQACPESTAAADAALQRVGLQAERDRPAGLLSHGGKRQLEIAMCRPPSPRCCCSTSRWPAWAPRRLTACSRCWTPCAPATPSCWWSTTWTPSSASPTASR
jgi:branched-chain amino acid transport system ATP-binding protein